MRLRHAALPFTFLSLCCAAFAASENNSFTLVQRGGKVVGRASYTIDKNKDGSFKVRSHFEYRTSGTAPAAEAGAGEDPTRSLDQGTPSSSVTDSQYSFEYKVDGNGDFLTGFTQDTASQTITSYQPGKTREQLTIGNIQGGVNGGTQTLAAPKPEYLVAPDYDPSALQVLLMTALAHPHSDNTYLLIVPGAGRGPRSQTQPLYVILQTVEDAAGTLDGKVVTLKHYRLNYNKGKAELYTDADGKLMEADMGPLGANYVRTKFTLDTPK